MRSCSLVVGEVGREQGVRRVSCHCGASRCGAMCGGPLSVCSGLGYVHGGHGGAPPAGLWYGSTSSGSASPVWSGASVAASAIWTSRPNSWAMLGGSVLVVAWWNRRKYGGRSMKRAPYPPELVGVHRGSGRAQDRREAHDLV